MCNQLKNGGQSFLSGVYKIAKLKIKKNQNKKMKTNIDLKKAFGIISISLFFYSCSAYKSVTDSTYLGMTKKEFIGVIKYPELELAYEGVEVYKTTKRVVRSGIAIYETHFFYFKNGQLVRIDKGEIVNPKQVIDLNINNN